MKVAIIVLFALIAVSQAAFTRSLVQQAQPVLSQALFRMRMSTTRSNAGFQTQLVDGLQTVVTDVLGQIEGAVGAFNVLVETVSQNIQGVYEELLSLGSNFIESGSAIITDFLQNILGGLFNNGKRGSIDGSAVLSVIQSLGLDQLFAQVSAHIVALIDQLGLGSLVQSALTAVVGEQTANAIIAAFTSKMGKGFWDSITSGLGDAWNFVTDGVSNAWDLVSGSVVDGFNWFVANLPMFAGLALQQVQAIATEFVQNAAAQALLAAGPHILTFVEWLAPYAVQLGDLYTQVMAIVNAFNNGIKLIY